MHDSVTKKKQRVCWWQLTLFPLHYRRKPSKQHCVSNTVCMPRSGEAEKHAHVKIDFQTSFLLPLFILPPAALVVQSSGFICLFFLLFTWTGSDYLSHPGHIQGDALRCFDILTATQDGYYFQRNSLQAGERGGKGGKGVKGQENVITALKKDKFWVSGVSQSLNLDHCKVVFVSLKEQLQLPFFSSSHPNVKKTICYTGWLNTLKATEGVVTLFVAGRKKSEPIYPEIYILYPFKTQHFCYTWHPYYSRVFKPWNGYNNSHICFLIGSFFLHYPFPKKKQKKTAASHPWLPVMNVV